MSHNISQGRTEGGLCATASDVSLIAGKPALTEDVDSVNARLFMATKNLITSAAISKDNKSWKRDFYLYGRKVHIFLMVFLVFRNGATTEYCLYVTQIDTVVF